MLNNNEKAILTKHNVIHIIGTGGIGVSRLASFFLQKGKRVSGSDVEKNEIVESLEKQGLAFSLGHAAENIPADCDLVIYTLAVKEDNPERAAATSRNIRLLTHFEAIGELSADMYTIAIAGTNGKSTTTAMLGAILEDAGFDPTVFLGSKFSRWGGNLRIGKSDIFVVEADELYRQFLSLSPDILVITNIEREHLDYYKDLHDIITAFEALAKKLPDTGWLVYNTDDDGSADLGQRINFEHKFSFGKKGKYIILKNQSIAGGKRQFTFHYDKHDYEGEMSIPGEYNLYNALGAISAAHLARADFDAILKSLATFKGIWRRFEMIGEWGPRKTKIISDYAHHPTALHRLKKTLREAYPKQRIALVFQPHQVERTKLLQQEFIDTLSEKQLDLTIITDIFQVTGREHSSQEVSGKDIFIEVGKRNPAIEYISKPEKSINKIKELISQYDVAVFAGAGDIYKIPIEIMKESVK